MTKRLKSKAAAPAQKLIYIGHNLSNGRLAHATVFSGGYPAHVLSLIETAPWLTHLMVPVAQYAEKMKEAAQKGTALNVFLTRSREL